MHNFKEIQEQPTFKTSRHNVKHGQKEAEERNIGESPLKCVAKVYYNNVYMKYQIFINNIRLCMKHHVIDNSYKASRILSHTVFRCIVQWPIQQLSWQEYKSGFFVCRFKGKQQGSSRSSPGNNATKFWIFQSDCLLSRWKRQLLKSSWAALLDSWLMRSNTFCNSNGTPSSHLCRYKTIVRINGFMKPGAYSLISG